MPWTKDLKVQRQPNEWSCLPTAFAIVLNIPVEEIIKDIGHGGSDIVFPDLEEPYCRRSFHIQELIDICLRRNIGVTAIEHEPVSEAKGLLYKPPMYSRRMDYYLINHIGVLTGLSASGNSHAVAWSGEKIFDPNGSTYNIMSFSIDTFFLITKFNITK